MHAVGSASVSVMYQRANEAHVETMPLAYRTKRTCNGTHVNVERAIWAQIALKERRIVKATHAMEALVCGLQLDIFVFVNLADMDRHACQVG